MVVLGIVGVVLDQSGLDGEGSLLWIGKLQTAVSLHRLGTQAHPSQHREFQVVVGEVRVANDLKLFKDLHGLTANWNHLQVVALWLKSF